MNLQRNNINKEIIGKMTKTKKIIWLLILQGWAMLWVVIGHAGPSPTLDDYPAYALFLHDFAYSFHMPLFIAISGFLFYLTRLYSEKWTYWAMLKEKLVRFGIPFVVFTFIALVMKSVFAGYVDRATTLSIGELINAVLYPYNGPMREFWFLATIMWCFALWPVWKFLLRNKWLSITALFGLAALSICHVNTEFLALRSFSKMVVYFYFGILYATIYKSNPMAMHKKNYARISFAAGIGIYIIGRVYSVPILAPIGGILFSLALWLERMCSHTFSSFRNYTYQIYLLGIFFQVLISLIRQKFGLPFTPLFIFNILVGLYVPVLISLLLEWINWKPLLLCVGLKNYNSK